MPGKPRRLPSGPCRPTSGKAARGAKSGSQRERADLAGSDLELFELLRAERFSIAKDLNVPPYVVFPDATLIALAKERPRDFDELLDIPGIGESKRERYGEAFLAVIDGYVDG